ncbi:NAD(P)H-binding protein [Jannaschia sp. W003]|uniref:NAD(P)H-binding protein n=1 Tax=Jannaschia sp. W003 TaxID=2867012 RepID=UPI0021A4597A|nr:NAD(P)H-binding protein [Jannaschia sp. W003]UWQ20145.1 hypothetical protein K3554_09010 [Jannaschia sp. W003]
MTLRVLLFGATGTVGAGVLLECLDHPGIGEVVCVVRRPSGRRHPKLHEVVHPDLGDLAPLMSEFEDVDGCLWAVGVPQRGASAEAYARITHDHAVAAARALHARSPDCRFVFVSAAGADGTERARDIAARTKGRAENAILGMGFACAVAFRPGAIAVRRGLRHRVPLYGWAALLAPAMRPFGLATSAEEIGRAAVAVFLGQVGAMSGERIGSARINALARRVTGTHRPA